MKEEQLYFKGMEPAPDVSETEHKPIAEFEEGKYQLFNIDDLPAEERLAALDAIEAQKQSTNRQFRAGAVAVAENGDKAVRHNSLEGHKGHAEMLAVAALYRAVDAGKFKLKLVALAGDYPTAKSDDTALYGPDVKVEDIEVHHVCAHCLKFISDYSRGNAIDEEGVEDKTKTVIILKVVSNLKQVVRTTLRAEHPNPHRVSEVDLEPLQRDAKLTTSFTKKGNGNDTKKH